MFYCEVGDATAGINGPVVADGSGGAGIDAKCTITAPVACRGIVPEELCSGDYLSKEEEGADILIDNKAVFTPPSQSCADGPGLFGNGTGIAEHPANSIRHLLF